MIGKVNQSNKRSTSDDNPWITTDHLQVIPLVYSFIVLSNICCNECFSSSLRMLGFIMYNVHIYISSDKEADSVLGFTKSAIYEVLKQIVLETLKNDDRSLERDPWGFLND